ncbi:hypothetical protein JYG23_08125 [Sedimentibacter sp. zth1]|uniref:hypothetical protein n=1 Tax=Sedimentibacter sp. zth1 TaxID=2816908 RepID=UPI001A91E9C7|nr:hypothetical protein [Sedimentibacter sp. zth1]QSX04675.1 hypothetical protein JYG23_08125 [Sedimentibacter sp. zth1]
MKKVVGLCGLCIVIMLLFAVACSNSDKNTLVLKEEGLSVANKLDYLAESEEYLLINSANVDIQSITKDIASLDYSLPNTIFKIVGLEDAILNEVCGDIKISKELQDIMGHRFSNALSSRLNGLGGVNNLIATSFLTYNDCIVIEGVEEETTYLYLYDDKYSVIVNFIPYDNDIVAVSGSFILNDDLTKIDTTEDLKLFLEDCEIINLDIELINF